MTLNDLEMEKNAFFSKFVAILDCGAHLKAEFFAEITEDRP